MTPARTIPWRPVHATGSRSGFSLATSLALVLVVSGVAGVLFYGLREAALERYCDNNLRQIYAALERYELEHGALPVLSFYPDDPRNDPASLIRALGPYGIDEETCVCPAAAPALRRHGISYIWNVRLNGKPLPRSGAAQWLVADMEILSDEVPPPHFWHYHALFSNGQIRRIWGAPRELRGY